MKKLLILILLLPSIAWGADYARMSPHILGGTGDGAAACTELTLGFTPTVNTYVGVGGAATLEYTAGQFVAGDWGTISKIQLLLQKNTGANITGLTFTIQLYNSDKSTVANGSCTFSAPNTTIPVYESPAYVGCVLTTPVQLTNTTTYWIGLNNAGAAPDATNYVRWSYDSTGGGGYDFSKDADGAGAWTVLDADAYVSVKFFTGAGCTND